MLKNAIVSQKWLLNSNEHNFFHFEKTYNFVSLYICCSDFFCLKGPLQEIKKKDDLLWLSQMTKSLFIFLFFFFYLIRKSTNVWEGMTQKKYVEHYK